MEIFKAFDNIFEGHDYTINGQEYQTQENMFGGEDIYENGRLIAQTQENIFGGEDIYEDGKLIVRTSENAFGGEDVYSTEFGYEGSTFQSDFGNDFLSSTGIHSFETVDMGNITTILNYTDPLAHVGSYVMPTMIL